MSLGTRVVKPLTELNLTDPAVIQLIAQVPRDVCVHAGTDFHRCNNCTQQEIRNVTTYETLFAISANQFLSQPKPPEVLSHDRRTYRSIEEARDGGMPANLLTSPTVIKKFETGQSVTIELRTPKLAESVDKAILKVLAEYKDLLSHVLMTCRDSGYMTFDQLQLLNHQLFQDCLIEYFRYNKTSFESIAHEYKISISTLTDFVLPSAMGLQAQTYLNKIAVTLVAKYPLLNEFFFVGKPVFSDMGDANYIKFFDPVFPSFDVHRVSHSANTLCTVGGALLETDIPAMLANTLFNREFPIAQLMVVTDQLQERGSSRVTGQLVNYFLYPKGTQLTFSSSGEMKASGVEITVLEIDGSPEEMKGSCDAKSSSDEARSLTVKLQVKALPSNEERILTVHFFKMATGKGLSLTRESDLQHFQQIYELSKTTPIGLQSSGSSIGRPSVIIFAFELAKYFLENASRLHSLNIYQGIDWMLQHIRAYNPAFINGPSDYLEGVRLAGLLYTRLSLHRNVLTLRSGDKSTTLQLLSDLSKEKALRELADDIDAAMTSSMLMGESAKMKTSSDSASDRREHPKRPALSISVGSSGRASSELRDPGTPRPVMTDAVRDSQTKLSTSGLVLSGSYTRALVRDYSIPVSKEFTSPEGSVLRIRV